MKKPTNIKDNLTIKIQQAIQQLFGESAFLEIALIPTDNPEHGDYSTAVALRLAKLLKKAPMEIANALVTELSKLNLPEIKELKVAPPGYINICLADNALINGVTQINKVSKLLGVSTMGKGKTIIMDFSSPNVAKPMGVHHLRSTVIGDALARLLRSQGYKVINWNHIGDWGTQFGKLIVMIKRDKPIKKIYTIEELLERYVAFTKEAKEHPELDESARLETKKLQQGDKQNRALWKTIVKSSLKEFNATYKLLGIKFNETVGESFYQGELQGVVDLALKKQVAKKSEGAIIIQFLDERGEEILPPFVIQKSDEAFLYATTDLASTSYRIKKYQPVELIYVVANQQTLHLEQMFRAAKMLGITTREKMVHVKFGMVLNAQGKKFATREGEIIYLNDLIEEGVKKVEAIIKARSSQQSFSVKELKKLAIQVAIGALKYNDLSHNRLHDVLFDWDRALSFEGNSAPYLMYSAVRVRGIIKKCVSFKKTKKLPVEFTSVFEKDLAKLILQYPAALQEAINNFEPHRLCEYLYQLARTMHSFYEHCPVATVPEAERSLRIELIKAVELTLVKGLRLLGIEVPKRM